MDGRLVGGGYGVCGECNYEQTVSADGSWMVGDAASAVRVITGNNQDTVVIRSPDTTVRGGAQKQKTFRHERFPAIPRAQPSSSSCAVLP